jgi:hypothetical protein
LVNRRARGISFARSEKPVARRLWEFSFLNDSSLSEISRFDGERVDVKVRYEDIPSRMLQGFGVTAIDRAAAMHSLIASPGRDDERFIKAANLTKEIRLVCQMFRNQVDHAIRGLDLPSACQHLCAQNGAPLPIKQRGTIHPKAMPVILTTPDEVETWMTAPSDEALKVQRPLPDGKLRIIARGVKEDVFGSATQL